MKIAYISNTKIPTNKAHGVHMMKMCEAFSKNGLDVTFFIPTRRTSLKGNPYEYFGVDRVFEIKHIFSIDFIELLHKFGYWLQYLSFLLFFTLRFLFVSRKTTVVYTREYLIAFIADLIGFKTVYEAHRIILKKKLFFKLVKSIPYIVTNSKGVAKEFEQRGFNKVLSYPNGVDPKEFDFSFNKEELRNKLHLNKEGHIVLYTGHLYEWKGIDTVIDAAKFEKSGDIQFVFVGGTKEDVKKCKDKVRNFGLKNIIFIGHKPKKDIPLYLKSADILLLPNNKTTEESIFYTSPMKMFEYMASGVPIVASNLPSIKEVVNESNAVLFESENPEDLIKAIKWVIKERNKALELAKRALVNVEPYTWNKRSSTILEFIKDIYDN